MRKTLLAIIAIVVIVLPLSARQMVLNKAAEKTAFSSNARFPAIAKETKLLGPDHSAADIRTWLYHHTNPAYYWPGESLIHAARFTMPSPTSGACTLLTASFAIYRHTGAANITALCSLFVFRDTIYDDIHKPGECVFADTFRIPPFGSVPAYAWFDIDVSGANLIFNGGEDFWLGCQIAHPDPSDIIGILLDGNANPDTTMNEYDTLPPPGPPADWFCDLYIDYLIEAEVGYTPAIMDDVGVIDIEMSSGYCVIGDSVSILVRIYNYGNNTQTSIPVSYDPGDGSAVVNETWTGSIGLGELDTYRFATYWKPTTAGVYNFKAWTALDGDEDPSNDTFSFNYYVFNPCPPYHVPPYAKDFNEGWGPYGDNPPFCGWEIVDYGDETPPEWNTNDWTHFTFTYGSNQRSLAGVIYNPVENQDEWLISPQFDCTLPGQYILGYWHYYLGYPTDFDTGYVLLTINDGLEWTEIAKYVGHTNAIIDSGYKTHDITALVAGQSNVKIAFRYFAHDAYYWMVDDFTLDYIPSNTTLTININPEGAGNVIKDPDLPEYPAGTWVKLTAEPNYGYQFSSWSGDLTSTNNPDSIYMNGNKTVTANFTPLGPAGWTQKEAVTMDLVPAVDKAIKDGGALVGVGNDYLYAFIGTKTNVFRKYTIATKSGWETVESLPFGFKYKPETGVDTTARNKKFVGKAAALCYDGVSKIYATRGNGTWDFWVYDIPSQTWTMLKHVPTPKAPKLGTALAYYDGYVYLLAGGHKPTDPTNFYAYNVNDSTWTIKTDVHFGPTYKPWKAGSCLTELGGKIYALKGGDKYNLFFVYDPGTNNWTDLESIPLPDTVFGSYKKKVLVKDGGCMVSDGSAIYAIKGGGTDCFWKYTPGTPGVWEMKEPIPVIDKKHAPKTGAAMAYADGKVWLLVGNKQPDFWCYTPGAKSVKPVTIASVTTEKTTRTYTFKFDVTPNPFTKLTTIRYTVPVSGKVSIKLYNATGRLIETITDGNLNAGSYTATLNAKNLTQGIYFLKYEDATNRAEIKLIVQ